MKIKTRNFLLVLLMMLVSLTVCAAEERYIVTFNDSVQFFSADGTKSNKDYCSATWDELQEYIEAGIVESYGIDEKVRLFFDNWYLDNIKQDFPESIGCLGNDIKVAVIDSGIVPGLGEKILPGYNYLEGSDDTTDNLGHGTLVSALIVSEDFGTSYKSRIVPLKCFEKDGDTYTTDILDAIIDAVDKYDCDVINMSLGFTTNNPQGEAVTKFKEKIDYAVSKGAIVVASVGNDGDTTVNYPAAFENVIGVASVDKNNEWSDFSNYNESVFVSAPGEGLSVLGEVGLAGTSFSTPQVSGLAAIAKCIDKSITQSDFAELVSKTAYRLSDEEYSIYYGYGLVDCEAAVKEMIKDDKFHISPIEKTDKNSSAVIYNNTDKKTTVCCICAYYDENDVLIKCIPVEVPINAYTPYTFENEYSGGKIRYMVWDGWKGIEPLAKVKIK